MQPPLPTRLSQGRCVRYVWARYFRAAPLPHTLAFSTLRASTSWPIAGEVNHKGMKQSTSCLTGVWSCHREFEFTKVVNEAASVATGLFLYPQNASVQVCQFYCSNRETITAMPRDFEAAPNVVPHLSFLTSIPELVHFGLQVQSSELANLCS